MMNDIDKNFAVSVTKLVCYRTSAKVRKMRIGTLSAHYNMLPSYLAKMRRINREFFFFLSMTHLGGEAIFNIFYVSFEALKLGFLTGCR